MSHPVPSGKGAEFIDEEGNRIMKNRLLRRPSIGIILVYTIAILFALSCILPMLNVFAMAFNDPLDNRRGGFILLPRQWSLSSFQEVFANYPIGRAYGVTIFRTLVGILLTLFINSAYAYALSKPHLLGRKLWNWYTIVPMYFAAGLIPYYLVLQDLHLTNTLWVYVIPSAATPFYIIVFRTFFSNIPNSIEESAKLDGAGYFILFFRFILPLSLPAVATIALFSGVAHWNDWFAGTVYVFKNDLWPMQTWLRYILNIAETRELSSSMDTASMIATSGSTVAAESLKMAMIVLSVAPILAIYPFMQRYFVAGVAVGSIKE